LVFPKRRNAHALGKFTGSLPKFGDSRQPDLGIHATQDVFYFCSTATVPTKLVPALTAKQNLKTSDKNESKNFNLRGGCHC
jgi:hypothetical protein